MKERQENLKLHFQKIQLELIEKDNLNGVIATQQNIINTVMTQQFEEKRPDIHLKIRCNFKIIVI